MIKNKNFILSWSQNQKKLIRKKYIKFKYLLEIINYLDLYIYIYIYDSTIKFASWLLSQEL